MIAVIENDQANGAERRQLLRVARDHGIPLSDVRYVSAGWLPKTTSGKLQRMRVASELGDV
jgi:acyl-coenzyme A synthetase/AMP-(fatty) acid ligase